MLSTIAGCRALGVRAIGMRTIGLGAVPKVVRSYHSYEHDEDPFFNKESPKYRILEKAMEFVPEYGFQHKAILESSRTFGYSDAIQSLFHNGTFDLIKFHLVRERLRLTEVVSKTEEFKQLSDENTKVKYLVKKRLEGNVPYGKHITQLQTYLVLPPNIGEASEELHKLSDDIRFLSGDSANDFAWYSKRLSLSTTYVALETFMAQDKSPNYTNTFELADKRLSNLGDLGQVYNDVEEFLFYTVNSGLNLIKSQATRG